MVYITLLHKYTLAVCIYVIMILKKDMRTKVVQCKMERGNGGLPHNVEFLDYMHKI